ncbi:MAG TPA: DNA adenine methylase [Chitinispirillaceae bacterium]|nr:DNA adenine methylase [Chitinispirillaceae bacterium]
MEEELSQVHLRLARVTIENLDWSDLLTRYDRPETFFYMDPPYYKMPFYKFNFEPMDFLKMSAILSGLSGKFIMSINDEPFIRETFSRFKIQEVDVRYSVQKEGSQVGRELLISNC